MRAGAFLLAAALAASACSEAAATLPSPGAAPDTIAAPAAPESETAPPIVARRIPPGSRVERRSAAGARVLSEGLSAAGAPCVRPDGRAVLFVGKEKDGDAYAVWECAADGSERKVLVRHDGDCQAAAYLPDGRIVYAGAVAGAQGPDGGPSQALFVAAGDGARGARITFGGDCDGDPTVLADGRVLFSSRRAAADGARFGLFTVHPDGSGLAPFRLDADGDAFRPVQQDDLDVRYLLVANGTAQPRTASWDAPMSAAAGTLPLVPKGEPGLPGHVAALPLVPRPRAQGHLSVVKDDRGYGTLYCVDARRGAAGGATLRVRAGAAPKDAAPLGDVPLAADGSFHVRVPHDTPLLLEVLDAAGRPVAAEHAPIWVRPNEVRGCVGCHDDVETAPPNVRPIAVSAAPADLSAGGGHVR